jgi:hypothetical protein
MEIISVQHVLEDDDGLLVENGEQHVLDFDDDE